MIAALLLATNMIYFPADALGGCQIDQLKRPDFRQNILQCSDSATIGFRVTVLKSTFREVDPLVRVSCVDEADRMVGRDVKLKKLTVREHPENHERKPDDQLMLIEGTLVPPCEKVLAVGLVYRVGGSK